jgi:spore coat polysaccharide biosynthesis predicted glycosyltransferase SpsG
MTSFRPGDVVALVRIICEGGKRFGFGHLRRSATLANAFKRNGFDVRVEPQSAEAISLLPASPSDKGDADLWLLDLPHDASHWVEDARRQKRPVVALDYIGTQAPDLVISIFHRGTVPEGVCHLVGLEYAIIRPEIAALAPAPTGRGVIIVMGGGDQLGLAEQAALRLHALGFEVTIVDGPLATTNEILPPEVSRLPKPGDIAPVMASSAWGVTSGGGAMMEMLCLGKPVHVIPRTPFEAALAQLVFDKGGLLGIGLDRLQMPSEFCSRTISRTARTLVDGKGVDRIVKAIESML